MGPQRPGTGQVVDEFRERAKNIFLSGRRERAKGIERRKNARGIRLRRSGKRSPEATEWVKE